MQVTNAIFDVPFGGSNPSWPIRVIVAGSDFEHRASPVVAKVGNVTVEAILVTLAGDGFVGLLATTPAVGDTLKVGYLDTDLIDTNIPFQTPVVP